MGSPNTIFFCQHIISRSNDYVNDDNDDDDDDDDDDAKLD